MNANLFNGAFSDNIRISPAKGKELRESMQEFGWIAEFPALVDENNLVLVGHRRLAIAKELNIEPVVKILNLGAGDDATAERLKIAIASNIGGAPLTKADRQHIAKHLWGIQRWAISRIGKALGVSKSQISRDLEEFSPGGNTEPRISKRGRKGEGRPKGSKKGSPRPKPVRLADGFATIGEAASAGIKVEMAGGTPDEAVRASSLTRQTYSIARDIVLLSERADLSSKDVALVKTALDQLNENSGITAPYELVKPIANKVWGHKGHRFKSDKKRIENFFESIAGVAAGCCAIATELTIPYLGPDQQAEALDTIREARDALDIIMHRIKDGGAK